MPQNPERSTSREVILTGEERRELLSRIEHSTGHPAVPETLLERAERAFARGEIARADRLVAELERSTSHLLGLEHLKARLAEAKQREKAAANLRKTEELLRRYLEGHKKPAAELALETLAELAPEHPRLPEYRRWVENLDREVELLTELRAGLEAGLVALRGDDPAEARRQLEALRQLDDSAPATFELAEEIARAEAGEIRSAGIENLKQRFEDHLSRHDFQAADETLEELVRHEVTKVTLDLLRRRLAEAASVHRLDQELARHEEHFARLLDEHRWQEARELAHQVGQRFPDHPRAAEMWNEVSRGEKQDDQEASVHHGIDTLEGFLAQGRDAEAQLALKLLRGKIEAERFAEYERRVAALGS